MQFNECCCAQEQKLWSYHVVMWREVKGVLSPQQFVVSVVHIFLGVISSIVIIVFNLYRNTRKQTLEANESLLFVNYTEG